MQIKKYLVIDPRGVVWDGKIVGRNGHITSPEDARIKSYLHFGQIKQVGLVADVTAVTAPAAPVVGAPSLEPGAAARVVTEASADLAAITPQPVRPEVGVRETADGGTRAVVDAPPVTKVAVAPALRGDLVSGSTLAAGTEAQRIVDNGISPPVAPVAAPVGGTVVAEAPAEVAAALPAKTAKKASK